MTQHELNKMWSAHLGGGRAEGVACRSTNQFEIISNVVSSRSWARPLGGLEWSEITPPSGNTVSEMLREF